MSMPSGRGLGSCRTGGTGGTMLSWQVRLISMAKIFSTNCAYSLPMHVRGPPPNGRKWNGISLVRSDSQRHLSGLNSFKLWNKSVVSCVSRMLYISVQSFGIWNPYKRKANIGFGAEQLKKHDYQYVIYKTIKKKNCFRISKIVTSCSRVKD